MSERLQERARQFLDHWRTQGALPVLQDSWPARMVAYYAHTPKRFSRESLDDIAHKIELLKGNRPPASFADDLSLMSGLNVGWECKKDDALNYYQELISLIEAIVEDANARET